jgi:hypothetical protein
LFGSIWFFIKNCAVFEDQFLKTDDQFLETQMICIPSFNLLIGK